MGHQRGNAIRILPGVYLVGSGSSGFDLTDALDCHIYLIDGDAQWAVVDSGSGRNSAQVIDNIRGSGVDIDRPGTLLVTHAHADHSGGAAYLKAAFPHIRVLAGDPASEWIASGDKAGISLEQGIASGAYPPEYSYHGCETTERVEGGTIFDLGGITVEALSTPGHADGHTCYLARIRDGRQVLFSGDCVFTDGRISLQNLHDARIPEYAASIAKLDSLGIDALLPGHFSISLQRAARHIAAAQARFAQGFVPHNSL
jgi:hydroxyacylglutathione hydrolase